MSSYPDIDNKKRYFNSRKGPTQGLGHTLTLKCVSINNQERKVRPVVMNINNINFFYPYNILVNKCSGSCNDIINVYSKLCVPDVVKNMNIKVFNKSSRPNETRYVSWHETCEFKCRLDTNVCNNKQRCSSGKFR